MALNARPRAARAARLAVEAQLRRITLIGEVKLAIEELGYEQFGQSPERGVLLAGACDYLCCSDSRSCGIGEEATAMLELVSRANARSAVGRALPQFARLALSAESLSNFKRTSR